MIKPSIRSIINDKIKTIEGDSHDIHVVGPIQLPVELDGETKIFQWYSWLKREKNSIQGDADLYNELANGHYAELQQSSVLVYGDFAEGEDALIRMHSICHTGDIFGSHRCDCGFQLKQSMRMITEHGTGALFYLANHEGRGIGLFSKAMAYLLQEEGLDTVDANLELGFAEDARDYSESIAILKLLRSQPVSIITNNPRKMEALREAGMHIARRVPLWGQTSVYNEKYLTTKVVKSGHYSAEAQHEVNQVKAL
ncbi:GTP cyclohydrolase II [Paenibacillus algorifonticola]|uniref:GTP cyclohydrolase II n=1 Tax=Paenibacillus algorifonticola TaxID=684063 RepID=A0A1I2G5X6_9BACL|nr:GTP cyclohydrolase II [Paenibacillus algorifonticola]SFF12116.1 GTP cyclohydrolase II [Paenibacillus algorifonticola]